MRKRLNKALHKAAVLTFEELGLMLPDTDLSGDQAMADLSAAVEVRFHGRFDGSLHVSVSRDVLTSVTANMLGEDESNAQIHQFDALGEIANVVCGNLLPSIAGVAAVFHLDRPKPIPLGAPASNESGIAPAARVEIGLDMGRAQLSLLVEDHALHQFEEVIT